LKGELDGANQVVTDGRRVYLVRQARAEGVESLDGVVVSPVESSIYK
jgi:hypothetical protein